MFNKIKESILCLFGYININKIRIPVEWTKTLPRSEKLREKMKYYNKNGKFMEEIVIDENNMLLDGYTTYLLANWNYYQYVKVHRIKEKQYIAVEKRKLIIHLLLSILFLILTIDNLFTLIHKNEDIDILETKIEQLEAENWNLIYELDSIKQWQEE